MIELLSAAQDNAYEHTGSYVIHANRRGRFPYLILTTFFFLLILAGLLVNLWRLITERDGLNVMGFLVFGSICAVFGYMSISYLIQLINIKELVLLPDQGKVQVRLERNKKVVSEHPIGNVSFTKDRVEHEEPYRASMKWFTLYDTKMKEQLISIRPGNRDTDGIAVEELTEFFQSVMRKKNAGLLS